MAVHPQPNEKRMTLQEAWPFLEAVKNGKTIQRSVSNYWQDTTDLLLWIGHEQWTFEKVRIKPEPRKVPLEPRDVKPGACVRHKTWLEHTWSPCAPIEAGLLILAQPAIQDQEIMFISWCQLQGGWSITNDGGKTWHRCEKEVV